MPQALIEIGGSPGNNDDITIGSTVQLSNADIGGESTYLVCVACAQTKPDIEFCWRIKGVKRRGRCLECEAARNRERYREQEGRYHKERAKLPEVRARKKERYQERVKDPEYRAAIRQYHRDRYKDPVRRKTHLNHVLKSKYGVDAEYYDDLLEGQRGVCAICKSPGVEINTTSGRAQLRLCVDHDHRTGMIRGLLCTQCNRAIGLLKDSVEVLEAAIGYLRRSEAWSKH